MNEPIDPKPPVTRTAAQAEALNAYNAACRALAVASHDLKEAQTAYDRAMAEYHKAHGSARALGVLP